MTYILDSRKSTDVNTIKHLMSDDSDFISDCVPSIMLYGVPGSGKTAFAKFIAKELDAEFIFGPCFDNMGQEQMIYDWDLGLLADSMGGNSNAKGSEALKPGFLLRALTSSQTKKTVLLLDEIDKAKPAVDTYLLSYLQECMINDSIQGKIEGNKKNLLIVFTSNKHRELNDALDRRMMIIREFHFPEKNDFIQQLKMINPKVNIYNSAKLHLLVELVYAYRKLETKKKPAQNQIADLVSELMLISNNKSISRKERYKMKFQSFLWKLSENADDRELMKKKLVDFFSKKKIPAKSLETYIGSML